MNKHNRKTTDPIDPATGKPKSLTPLKPGSSKYGRLLWDSYYRGTYKKAEHGPLL